MMDEPAVDAATTKAKTACQEATHTDVDAQASPAAVHSGAENPSDVPQDSSNTAAAPLHEPALQPVLPSTAPPQEQPCPQTDRSCDRQLQLELVTDLDMLCHSRTAAAQCFSCMRVSKHPLVFASSAGLQSKRRQVWSQR
jgi:hypothetical protein